LSAFSISSSMNGSVATLSGLVQLPLGAENPELPQEDTDESEKDEQTDPERANDGRCVESLMSAHSCAGLSGPMASMRGTGVFGGLEKRLSSGMGDKRPVDVGVGWILGLESTGSDISMVGITVSVSVVKTSGSANSGMGVMFRLRLIFIAGRGGGGGCVALCPIFSCWSGVFGSCALF